MRNIEALDFEHFAGGHGPLSVKEDVTSGRIYQEELREQVLEGVKAGQTDNELDSNIMMAKYKD